MSNEPGDLKNPQFAVWIIKIRPEMRILESSDETSTLDLQFCDDGGGDRIDDGSGKHHKVLQLTAFSFFHQIVKIVLDSSNLTFSQLLLWPPHFWNEQEVVETTIRQGEFFFLFR